MTWRVAAAGRADIGSRSRQEDAFGIWPPEAEASPFRGNGLLVVVTDGMGGHAGGEIAGALACETFTARFSELTEANKDVPGARLQSALLASNAAIKARRAEDDKLARMGCTLVAAWMDEAGLRWVSVGDSLLLRVRDGKVLRLNADHSLGAFLDERVRRHEISDREAAQNPYRNALRSALTGKTLELVDLRKESFPVQPGDWLILASDGIATLSESEIAHVVEAEREADPGAMAARLITAVRGKEDPNQDNTTVLALKVAADPECPDEAPTRVLRAEPEPEPGPEPFDATDDEMLPTQPFLRAFGVSNETSRYPLVLFALGLVFLFAVGWALRALFG